MKIVYIVGDIYNSGGIERILSVKSNYLVNNGFEVAIVVINKTTKVPFFAFDAKVKFYYLNFEFEKERVIKKRLNFKKNKQQFLDKMSELFLEIKPDIAVSSFCKYSQYIYELKDGSKKIIERHFAKYKRAYYYSKLDKYYLGRLITYLYRRKDYNVVKHFDKFVVLTQEDKNDWGSLPNIEVIGNTLTFVPEGKSELRNKRVIAIGRLNQQKQFEKLIDIWKEIIKKYPDWKLCIFGGGEKEKSLKEQIKKYSLTQHIEINKPTKNIEKELKESSIFVMTSKYEGMPMVLLETMACGVPAVSFACKCGPGEIIKNGEDGFLIPFNNTRIFIDKLSSLIENEELRKEMGNAAAKNILRFSEDKIMEKWIKLFKE